MSSDAKTNINAVHRLKAVIISFLVMYNIIRNKKYIETPPTGTYLINFYCSKIDVISIIEALQRIIKKLYHRIDIKDHVTYHLKGENNILIVNVNYCVDYIFWRKRNLN